MHRALLTFAWASAGSGAVAAIAYGRGDSSFVQETFARPGGLTGFFAAFWIAVGAVLVSAAIAVSRVSGGRRRALLIMFITLGLLLVGFNSLGLLTGNGSEWAWRANLLGALSAWGLAVTSAAIWRAGSRQGELIGRAPNVDPATGTWRLTPIDPLSAVVVLYLGSIVLLGSAAAAAFGRWQFRPTDDRFLDAGTYTAMTLAISLAWSAAGATLALGRSQWPGLRPAAYAMLVVSLAGGALAGVLAANELDRGRGLDGPQPWGIGFWAWYLGSLVAIALASHFFARSALDGERDARIAHARDELQDPAS